MTFLVPLITAAGAAAGVVQAQGANLAPPPDDAMLTATPLSLAVVIGAWLVAFAFGVWIGRRATR